MKLRKVVHIGDSALKRPQHKNQESKVSIAVSQIGGQPGLQEPFSQRNTQKKRVSQVIWRCWLEQKHRSILVRCLTWAREAVRV